jgi:integrase/recombinase XerD
VQTFFTDRLMHQRQASPNTIASYRDTFRLLLQFAQQQTGKPPTKLTMEILEPAFLGAFLNHLERDRGVCARSRNVRLAAIHSFFRFVAFTEPSFAALAQRVLAIPNKRFDRRPIEYLTRPEVEAPTLCSGSSHVGRAQGLRLAARRRSDRTPHIGTHWSSLR